MIIHAEFDTNLIKLTNSTQSNKNASNSDKSGIKQKNFKETLDLQNDVKKSSESKEILDVNTTSEEEVVNNEGLNDIYNK